MESSRLLLSLILLSFISVSAGNRCEDSLLGHCGLLCDKFLFDPNGDLCSRDGRCCIDGSSDCSDVYDGRCIDPFVQLCDGFVLTNPRRYKLCPTSEICCLFEEPTSTAPSTPRLASTPAVTTPPSTKPTTTPVTTAPLTKSTTPEKTIPTTTQSTTPPVTTPPSTKPTTPQPTTTKPTTPPVTTPPSTKPTTPQPTTTKPTTPPVTTPPSTKPTTPPSTSTTSRPKTTSTRQQTSTITSTTQGPRPTGCGVSSISPEFDPSSADLYIIGGSAAPKGAWPWMVSVLGAYGTSHSCGGAILSESWIVTSARCFYFTKDTAFYKIRVGEYNIGTKEDGEETYDISSITSHPGWDQNTFANDIALVRLTEPIDLSKPNANTLCLPTDSMLKDRFSGEECWTIGWGLTKGEQNREILQQVKARILPQEECQKSGIEQLKDTNICFGDARKGACQGDDGGPLMCSRSGRYYLVGVASWAAESCDRPSVFTRVTEYMPWITKVIGS